MAVPSQMFIKNYTSKFQLWCFFICWLWKSIVSGKFIVDFLLDLKIVNEDFSESKVNSLAWNQEVNWIIIFLPVVIISFILLLWKKIVVSSANSLTLPSGQQPGPSVQVKKNKLHTYIIYKKVCICHNGKNTTFRGVWIQKSHQNVL